jgi:hypothetical protein
MMVETKMKGALFSILIALLLWAALESCTGWTDAELEQCTGISIEMSQR